MSVLVVAGFMLGLPMQAAQVGWMGGMVTAMSGDEMAPSGDCQHCDMGATIDMSACHGLCVVMPVLLPRHPLGPAATLVMLGLERTSDHLSGQTPAPDPSPPKASII